MSWFKYLVGFKNFFKCIIFIYLSAVVYVILDQCRVVSSIENKNFMVMILCIFLLSDKSAYLRNFPEFNKQKCNNFPPSQDTKNNTDALVNNEAVPSLTRPIR